MADQGQGDEGDHEEDREEEEGEGEGEEEESQVKGDNKARKGVKGGDEVVGGVEAR